MFGTRILNFVLFVLCCQNVLCGKMLLCDLDNSNCLTEGAKRVYPEIVKGGEGIPSSDPLYADEIIGDLPKIKYTRHNNTLTGLMNCFPENVMINSKEKTFIYNLVCKHLILTGLYEVSGDLGPMFVEGKGDYKVDYYDYAFLFTGDYDKYVGKDEKLHFTITKYVIDIDARGKVVHDYKNLYNGDQEKSAAIHKYANENWKLVDKAVRMPVWNKFMDIFIKNVNSYLNVFPVEHIFSYEA